MAISFLNTFKIGFIAGVLLLADGSAQAGELFGNQSRRLNQGGNIIRMRRIQPSTRASRVLSKSGRSSPTLSFAKSSPYENRIYMQERAMAKYERDVGTWERKVAALEYRTEKREERLKQQALKKAEVQKIREQRMLVKEQAKVARVKAKGDSSASGIFSRVIGSNKKSEKQPTNEIKDEKSKKAEAFFGGVEDPETVQEPKKLGFFARLKKAMFGG